MKWTKKNDHCYEADTLHGITFEIYRDKIPRWQVRCEEKLESGDIHCFEMVVLNLLSFIRPDVEGHNLADTSLDYYTPWYPFATLEAQDKTWIQWRRRTRLPRARSITRVAQGDFMIENKHRNSLVVYKKSNDEKFKIVIRTFPESEKAKTLWVWTDSGWSKFYESLDVKTRREQGGAPRENFEEEIKSITGVIDMFFS